MSIEDHRVNDQTMSTTAILQMHELSRYEKRFGPHPEISKKDDEQLIHVMFESKKLCWDCARPVIEEAMHWKFDYLDRGISLDKHEEIFEFLIYYQPLSDDWNNLLLWNFLDQKFQFLDDDLLREQLLAFESQGVSPENIKSMVEWLDDRLIGTVTTDQLAHCTERGYRSADDLELLAGMDFEDELSDFENFGSSRIPHRKVLVDLGLGWIQYEQFYMTLLTLDYSQRSPYESEVVALVQTGLTVEQLSVFRDDSLDSEWAEPDRSEFLQSISDGLNEEDCNFRGVSAFLLLSRTVKALSDAGLVLNYENLARYWDLSAELILFVIDHDLLNGDAMRIARLVETPAELVGWLERDDDAIEADEIHEWVLAGFDAEDATKWKREGFNAEIAQQWRAVIDDPVVAQRRISAGIQIGDKE